MGRLVEKATKSKARVAKKKTTRKAATKTAKRKTAKRATTARKASNVVSLPSSVVTQKQTKAQIVNEIAENKSAGVVSVNSSI